MTDNTAPPLQPILKFTPSQTNDIYPPPPGPESPCPACGYCPTCKRGFQPAPFVIPMYPNAPWYSPYHVSF